MASLRLLSPGAAATDGVTYFFLKKLTTFSHRALQSGDLLTYRFLVHPVFFLNSATKINFSRVSPPRWRHSLNGVTRGGPPPPSDATASQGSVPDLLIGVCLS